jgi:hypothetical protein
VTEVDWETWQEIQRELSEPAEDTPERRDLFRRADALYRKWRQVAPSEDK